MASPLGSERNAAELAARAERGTHSREQCAAGPVSWSAVSVFILRFSTDQERTGHAHSTQVRAAGLASSRAGAMGCLHASQIP